jgi:hypothetical protein
VPKQSKSQRLDDRLDDYDPDVAGVIRLVLLEEQRRLGLKSSKDIVSVIEAAIEAAVVEDPRSSEPLE